jgi:hypothetical protein
MSTDDIQARVAATRSDLENTLDSIEDKLNVPKQMGILGKRVEASYEDNPVPWIIGATAVAISAVGLVAWALFSDD